MPVDDAWKTADPDARDEFVQRTVQAIQTNPQGVPGVTFGPVDDNGPASAPGSIPPPGSSNSPGNATAPVS